MNIKKLILQYSFYFMVGTVAILVILSSVFPSYLPLYYIANYIVLIGIIGTLYYFIRPEELTS